MILSWIINTTVNRKAKSFRELPKIRSAAIASYAYSFADASCPQIPLSTVFFSSEIPILSLAVQIVLLKDSLKKVYRLYQLGERGKPNCQIQARLFKWPSEMLI